MAVTKRLRFEILSAKDRAQKVLDEAEALLDG